MQDSQVVLGLADGFSALDYIQVKIVMFLLEGSRNYPNVMTAVSSSYQYFKMNLIFSQC